MLPVAGRVNGILYLAGTGADRFSLAEQCTLSLNYCSHCKLVGGMKLQMMVYADDICVTANTPEALQETLSVAGKAAK